MKIEQLAEELRRNPPPPFTDEELEAMRAAALSTPLMYRQALAIGAQDPTKHIKPEATLTIEELGEELARNPPPPFTPEELAAMRAKAMAMPMTEDYRRAMRAGPSDPHRSSASAEAQT